MQRTTRHRFIASTRVLVMALALLAAGACSEDPEQKLRKAAEHLDDAQEDAQKAQKRLKAEKQVLEDAREQMAKDRQTAAAAQGQVAAAEAEVRLYATDEAVFREVQRRLLDDSKLLDTAVSVQVSQGVVTLTGSVTTAALRARAGELAKTSPGVVSVVNDVQVAGANSTKPGASPAPAKTGAPKTGSGAKPAAQGESG